LCKFNHFLSSFLLSALSLLSVLSFFLVRGSDAVEETINHHRIILHLPPARLTERSHSSFTAFFTAFFAVFFAVFR
jgi:hypothetical protein